MKCVACNKGRKWECSEHGNCNLSSISMSVSSNDTSSLVDGSDSESSEEEKSFGPVREIKTYKDDSVLRDQQSTGRKRAAIMYPLDRDELCEWSFKKNCGGGAFPIVGCLGNKQADRHHGPDKNTLNNEEGNVHRICTTCHSRWHARNDPSYVWGSIYAPHDPSIANEVEIRLEDINWTGVKLHKVRD